MAEAKLGSSVKVHYTGRLDDGTVFDSSKETEPLAFTIGKGEVIPGFEQAVVGMLPGETKTAIVPADLAYGPHREDMVAQMARKDIPIETELGLGHQLEVSQEDGPTFLVMVTELSEDSVTLDANHPLAGKDLTFDIEMLEVA